MSFTFLPPGDAFMPTMTERFAEAEKLKIAQRVGLPRQRSR
jgi:hypothetical protein